MLLPSHHKLLRKIENARRDNDPRRVRRLQRRLFRDPAAKRCAAVAANRRLKRAEQVSDEEIGHVARTISLYGPSDEPIRSIHMAKSDGGVRLIQDFGIQRRARQLLTRWTLQPFFNFSSRQYEIAGRGGTTAAVMQAIADIRGGFGWVTYCDFRDFYPSVQEVNLDRVVDLPRSVIHHVVMESDETGGLSGQRRTDDVSVGNDMDEGGNWVPNGNRDRHGLPQGSMLSSFIGSQIIARHLEALPATGRVIAFRDDVWLFGRCEHDTLEMSNILRREANSHPAGPFQLHQGPVQPCTEYFEMLGYGLEVKRGGETEVSPSITAMAKWERRLLEKVEQRAFDDARTYCQNWSKSFSLWPEADRANWLEHEANFWIDRYEQISALAA